MYFIYNECIVTKILWVSVFVWSSSADRHFNIVAPRPLICPHTHPQIHEYKYTNTNTKMQIQIQKLLHHVPRFVYTHIRAKKTASLENNCSMTAMMILMIIDNDGDGGFFVDLSIFWWLWWWQWYAEEDGVEASQPLAPTKLFRIFLNFSFLTFFGKALVFSLQASHFSFQFFLF